MNFLNRFTLVFILAISVSISGNASGFYPNKKPVTVIIPFAPGGGVDITFRNLQKYSIDKGIELVAVYKPGADGIISMRELQTAPADGYTITVTTVGVVANYTLQYPDEKVQVIGGIRDSIGAFVANPKTSIMSIDDLTKGLARGDDIKFGYGAPGQLMLLEQLFEFAKSKNKPLLVPYRGGAPVVNDLLSGTIDVAQVPFSLVKGHIDAGKLRLLATTRAKLSEYNTPTIESKFPKWKEYDGFGIVVHKNTDPSVVRFWGEYLNNYLSNKQVQEEFIKDFTIKATPGSQPFIEAVNGSKQKLAKIKN